MSTNWPANNFIEADMKLEKVRAAYPHTKDLVYMNHAAVAPVGTHVKEAIDTFLAERHRTNIENFFDFQPKIEDTRGRIATMLGTEASQIAFAPNTSYGLNILALGLDWQPGDRILIPGCEFPANVFPFMFLERKGVHVDLIPDTEGTFTIEDIEQKIRPETRLLSISWVQFLSGFKVDLQEIGRLCKAHDILFCVDAIQAMGALEINVEACGIDFLASGCHKWMMATQGIGVVYAAQPLLDQLYPCAGWLHGPIDWEKLTEYNLAFHDDGRRFRLGTENAMGLAALGAALKFYQDAGPAWCEARVLSNARRLREGLDALGLRMYGSSDEKHASGIVAVAHPKADAFFEALRAEQIYIAVRNGLLRFAPTYYNSEDEVDRVLEVCKKLLVAYPV